MAGTHGGKRERAGRKPGQVSEETRIAKALRERLAQEVEKRFENLVRAAFDSAEGHMVEKTNDDGEPFTYFKSPDTNAIKYLFDQVIGKAKENIEIDNPAANAEMREANEKLNKIIENAKLFAKQSK